MVRTELPPQVTTQIRPLQSEGRNFVENPFETLTPREREVIALIAQGLSNSKIGSNLSIKTRTVERHIATIYSKLNIYHKDAEKSARVKAAAKYINQNPDFKNPFDGYKIHEPFTKRQTEVLVLVGQELPNKAIGKILFIKEKTVWRHIGDILGKIGYDEKEQNGRVVMMLVSKAKLKTPVR